MHVLSKSILFLFLTCFVFLSSCKKNKETVENQIVFDTIHVSTIQHLDNDSTRPSCSLKIDYIAPVKYANDSILALIQHELNILFFDDEVYEYSTPQVAVEQYKKAFEDNYKEESKSFIEGEHFEGIDGEKFYSIYKTIESKVLFNQSDILSYQILTMDYKGEEGSSSLYRNIVFDLKTGLVVTEETIFADDYHSVLNKILIDKILSQNKAKTIDELHSKGIMLDDFTTNDNFSLDSKGITYIFNNEYSTPTSGRITVSLSYPEIETLLRDNSPITQLVEE